MIKILPKLKSYVLHRAVTKTQTRTWYNVIERRRETEPGVEVTDTGARRGDVKLETVFPSVARLHNSSLSVDRPRDGYGGTIKNELINTSASLFTFFLRRIYAHTETCMFASVSIRIARAKGAWRIARLLVLIV